MDEKARITCDVAVIGAGLAGLTAGVRAAQAGRKAVLFEKSPDSVHLNNSRMTSGVFHLALADILGEENALEQRIIEVTGGAAHRGLARALARDSKRMVRWLQALGVRFIRGSPEPWHNFVLAPPAIAQLGRHWQGRGGDVMLRTLEAELKKRGGEIKRGHEARHLCRESGRCAGFEGASLDGRPFEVIARATVIADGGFQANRELLHAHLTPAPDKVVQRNAGNGTGDGLRMAKEFGAAVTDLRGFYGHVLSRDALANDTLWPYPWADELARSCLVVGADGKRFADEGLGGVYLANRIAALPDPASATVVFDQAGWEGPGTERFLPPNPNMIKAGGTVLKAATLADLARTAGIAEEGLASQVETYNRALKSGGLEQLNPTRTTSKFRPVSVERPPFYAIPVCAGITYTMGGIAIDECSRVTGEGGQPIAGLYAAGSTVGGLEGGEKAGYLGGLCVTGVTALRAAEHIIGALDD
ncbi:MAG: FAD-binding protein [Betaproteobacteria bacterium]|nr:FAD-binding protein [Betaproteobacteria bacterium]